jgi:hypothetical protein
MAAILPVASCARRSKSAARIGGEGAHPTYLECFIDANISQQGRSSKNKMLKIK